MGMRRINTAFINSAARAQQRAQRDDLMHKDEDWKKYMSVDCMKIGRTVYDDELTEPTVKVSRSERKQQIMDLVKSGKCKTVVEISTEMEMSHNSIAAYVRDLIASGHMKRKMGRSQRILSIVKR